MPSKKSKKPFKSFTTRSLGIATNIAVGPLGFRAALDANPKGERNCSYRELGGDRADSILDEDNPKPSRVVFHETENRAQEPLVPGPSTTVAVHDIEQEDRPASECYLSLPSRVMLIRISAPLSVRRDHQPYRTGG